VDEVVDQGQSEYDVDEAVDRLGADYDAAPYDSHAFPQSAPGQLAAIAYLFGLDTPEVSTARVLEIGCASGGNLIPFAATHPGARAVGIDLSPVQIGEGRRRAQALGLGNLELVQGDIARMDLAALGQFDFVISHGVYSWVPENVQEAILAAFHTLMVPEGVGYLSYNVYPGWKAKEIVRDAMLLRGGGRGTPVERVGYARGMIDFLQEVAPADSVLARALADYKAIAAKSKDYYLLHEELETFNAPCYLLELLERAGEHDLALSGGGGTSHNVRRQLRRQSRGALAQGMRAQPGVARAVPGFRRQPHVPADAAGACRTRTADSLPAGPQSLLPPAFRRMGATCRRGDSVG
jgi:SAM-dependent methyltransferase